MISVIFFVLRSFSGFPSIGLAVIYGALDLVALSSRNEGTPLSLIEGMAAARPVVATAVGTVPDVSGDADEDGLAPPPPGGAFRLTRVGALVRPADPPGLARAMAHLFENPQLWGGLWRTWRNCIGRTGGHRAAPPPGGAGSSPAGERKAGR